MWAVCGNLSAILKILPADFRQDAAAAALFTACKIEDTLKKSREVLCAAWNLKLPSSEHLSPDDPVSLCLIPTLEFRY